MNLLRLIENNKLFAFIAGTVLIQGFVFSVAAYMQPSLLSKTPSAQTFAYGDHASESAVSDPSNKPQSDSSTGNYQQAIEDAPAFPAQTDSSQTEKAANEILSNPSNSKNIVYKITAGDTLTKIWTQNNASHLGGIKAAEAFKKANIALNNLRLGQEVHLTISDKNEITQFSMKLPQGKSITLQGNSKDGYEAQVYEPKISERERKVSYPITNSFSASAREVSVPSNVVDDLVDLFSGRIDFRKDLQPGDSFTVIYTERTTEDGELVDPGPVKAISIETGGKLLVAIRHVGKDGKERYFNESAEALGNSFLRYPLRFTRISSIFTESRFHPVLKRSRPHNGIDFAAPTGTEVRTVGDGIIEMASYNNGAGNFVKIKHNDRYSTAYMHLSKIAYGIRPGVRVTRGEQIGAVGMTGLATGPHLHFSLYDKGSFVNPLTANLPVFSDSENAIPKTYLASTLESLKQQHELVRFAAQIGLTKNV